LTIDPAVPTSLYTGTNFGGVFKSVDGGENWNEANNGLMYNFSVSTLVIDPATPTCLYAVINNGVFKSMDAGESWEVINTGLADIHVYVHTLVIDPADPTSLYLGTSSGVFKGTYNNGN
jgi:photosystem II stability/assembly factor-like uncharacterized protein